MATPQPANAPAKNPQVIDSVEYATKKPAKAPASIMPSMPTLSTPARCETASPSAENKIGVARRKADAIMPMRNI